MKTKGVINIFASEQSQKPLASGKGNPGCSCMQPEIVCKKPSSWSFYSVEVGEGGGGVKADPR